MDTLFDPYFHFCFATGNLSQASLTHSLWVHDFNCTHSLVSLEWSKLLDQLKPCLTENCLHADQEMVPLHHKGRGVVSVPICANKVRNGPASADQGCSTASKATAMCTACHDYARPPPPSHLFC